MAEYILSIDQSTQGTKVLLFDERGKVVLRADRPHGQIITDEGYVEHNPDEILENTLALCKNIIDKLGDEKGAIKALGIANQRETSLAWNKESGEPVCNAVVWQCSRGEEICSRHKAEGLAEYVFETTGLPLSPYFPASKLQWIMENVEAARALAAADKLAFGTVDSWLVYKLTKEKRHLTDFSNASRTQLFDIRRLKWDERLCESFNIPLTALPSVEMSDAVFGHTDLGGALGCEIPVCAVMGDSHAALFGQNCRDMGGIKATYGTGSSVMMNTGSKCILSENGLATSLAWGIGGNISYVLEGNLNYTGAVITWLKDEVKLIEDAGETEELARKANKTDTAYFVPAFTGLGAPYWKPWARGSLTGITRTTGKNEIVRACVECIGYQIADLVRLMREACGEEIKVIKVDGAPTGNGYLMEFQSNIADIEVRIPDIRELSAMGAAYLAGSRAGVYNLEEIFETVRYTSYSPDMDEKTRKMKYEGWQTAVAQVIGNIE